MMVYSIPRRVGSLPALVVFSRIERILSQDVPRLPSHPTIMPVLQQRQQRQRTRTREPCGVRGARRPARDPRS
jgi:hypothetical protein